MWSQRLGLVCAMLCITMAIPIFGEEPQPSETSNTVEQTQEEPTVLEFPQIKIEVLKQVPADQCKRKSQPGDFMAVHFVGKIAETGIQFDTSLDKGMPFTFHFGTGQVIPGWDQGLLQMCVGEKRRLTVPPHLAYGERGAGDKIPPNTTLLFEVELVNLQDTPPNMPPPQMPFTPPPMRNVFKDIDTNEDKQLSREEVSLYLRNNEKFQGIPSPPESEHNKMLDEIFKNEDANQDGVISFDEFKGPKHDEL